MTVINEAVLESDILKRSFLPQLFEYCHSVIASCRRITKAHPNSFCIAVDRFRKWRGCANCPCLCLCHLLYPTCPLLFVAICYYACPVCSGYYLICSTCFALLCPVLPDLSYLACFVPFRL